MYEGHYHYLNININVMGKKSLTQTFTNSGLLSLSPGQEPARYWSIMYELTSLELSDVFQ